MVGTRAIRGLPGHGRHEIRCGRDLPKSPPPLGADRERKYAAALAPSGDGWTDDIDALLIKRIAELLRRNAAHSRTASGTTLSEEVAAELAVISRRRAERRRHHRDLRNR